MDERDHYPVPGDLDRWRDFVDQSPRTLLRAFSVTGWQEVPPIPVLDIAVWLGVAVRVVPRSQPQPNWSGALDRREQTAPIIWVRARDTREHRRFTIAHELGHLLHDTVHSGELHRDVAFTDGPRAFMERDANNFAAELLMPEAFVSHAVRLYGAYEYAAIASMFEVSRPAMMYRLQNLRYLP